MRKEGKVKWFNSEKGYGFLECENQDYFVHFRSIKTHGYKSLKDGQLVSFMPKESQKGPLADEVEVFDASLSQINNKY